LPCRLKRRKQLQYYLLEQGHKSFIYRSKVTRAFFFKFFFFNFFWPEIVVMIDAGFYFIYLFIFFLPEIVVMIDAGRFYWKSYARLSFFYFTI
jgi:hypothetical protein